MGDRPGDHLPALWRVILIPSAITLGVTLLRLGGELQGWPRLLFSSAPGGGAALVGITWLIPVFGVHFARRLAPGERDLRPLRVLGESTLALAVVFGLPVLVGLLKKEQSPQGVIGVFAVASILGALGGLAAWPALGRTLLAYGLAARIPVLVVMYLAMSGGWQTHYDALPPGFPAVTRGVRWFWLAFLPQITIWMALTVVVGTMAGALALTLIGVRDSRRARVTRPAAPAPRPSVTVARPPAGLRPSASPPLVRPAPPRGPRRP